MARSPRWLVLKGDVRLRRPALRGGRPHPLPSPPPTQRDAAVRVLRELRGADDVRVEITTLEPGYTGDDDGEDDQVRRGTHTAGSEPAADDAPQPQQGAGEEGKQGAFSAARPELDPGMKSTWDTRAPLTLGDLWRDPVLRFSLIASVVLQLGQQLSAINAVFYYSTNVRAARPLPAVAGGPLTQWPQIFAKIGVDPPELGTVLVGAVNVVATGLAVFLMDRTGRRVLLTMCAATHTNAPLLPRLAPHPPVARVAAARSP